MGTRREQGGGGGLGDNPRLGDIYESPVGRDAIDKLLLQLGLPRIIVDNALVARLRLRSLARLRPTLGPGIADALLELVADHPQRGRNRPSGATNVDAARSAGTSTRNDDGADSSPGEWWRTAVFYQVYPRSFCDSDGDGIGDLAGITARIDHLYALGVDCLWLSPIFDSPGDDAGYDVRDYRAIDATMGTLADLDALVAACHERGMRIICDLVVNHTSAEHEWFRRAREDPDGPYGSYYFLRRSPRPPNNWASFFGGPAWRRLDDDGDGVGDGDGACDDGGDAAGGTGGAAGERLWALHLFGPGQMDLDWANPDVREEVAEIVRFWRARGIDGFRLDVINYVSKRAGLPDGDEHLGALFGYTGIEHYFFGPDLLRRLAELRERGFARRESDPPPSSTVRARSSDGEPGERLPPDRVGVMVGETPGVGLEMGRLLTAGEPRALDLTFDFDVLDAPGRTRWDDYRYPLWYLKRFSIEAIRRLGPGGAFARFLDNHDNPRMLSKVLGDRDSDPELRAAAAKALAAIQLLLPGAAFLYQGQEIAAIDQRFDSIGELRDIESLRRFEELRAAGKSEEEAFATVLPGARDHARAPMRWEPGEGRGFSLVPGAAPWQPGAEDAPGFTVAEQAGVAGSVLEFHRELVALRRRAAFARGGIEFVTPRSRKYFGWVRRCGDTGGAGGISGESGATEGGAEAYLVEVNLTARRIRVPRRARNRAGSSLGPFEVRITALEE
ncbi:alpha-amylase family glycosyl hydrolase [Dietzia sp.]|uniref:alpha-amylase family glycosyl hydrolase n=1 Tax=Dietzia sp. TaxID=1871616 RepID=UPI002FDB1F43